MNKIRDDFNNMIDNGIREARDEHWSRGEKIAKRAVPAAAAAAALVAGGVYLANRVTDTPAAPHITRDPAVVQHEHQIMIHEVTHGSQEVPVHTPNSTPADVPMLISRNDENQPK